MKIANVYEDDYGVLKCSLCDCEIECDKNGDMPLSCPVCGKPLDYTTINQ